MHDQVLEHKHLQAEHWLCDLQIGQWLRSYCDKLGHLVPK